MAYRVHSGLIAGREHILEGRNCQDALYTLTCKCQGRLYHVGVVADGCSAGKHSEVGAQLAVRFIAEDVRRLLQHDVAFSALPGMLFGDLVHFLKEIVAAYHFVTPGDLVAYVEDYLLFTVIGYVVSEGDQQQMLVFAAGDGIVILNEQRYLLDQQNAPHYVGYQVIERSYLRSDAPTLSEGFELYQLPPGEELIRLALGSDAWLTEQPLLDQVWSNRGRGELQMRMNAWSNARHLRDDASLIVVERYDDRFNQQDV